MIAVQLVFQLGDAVSLVLIAKVFYSMTLLTQGADDLLGLLGWDAGVVPALNDHERRLNVVDLCDGRYGAEDLPVVRQRAVFAFAVCAAVFRRIFKEGLEVVHTPRCRWRSTSDPAGAWRRKAS